MKLRRLLIVGGLLTMFAAVMAAALCWQFWSAPTNETGRDVVVQVPRGSVLPAVADTLVVHDLLHHRSVFVWGARISGHDREIRAGRYALPRGLSPRDLLDRLVEGRTVPVKVTIREGEAAASIAREVASFFSWTATDFLAAADSLVRALMSDPDFASDSSSLPEYEQTLHDERARTDRLYPLCEGYLFPETYHFAEGIGAVQVADVVMAEGLAHWRGAFTDVPRDDRPLASLHDVLTLAAIVEAETPHENEMPRVAAVYLNRLSRRRHLEADPTIAHATNKRGRRILYADLEVASPYNTYRRPGLPPGPICSPGLAAVRAALTPEPGFDALYFVADGQGGHVFSRTLEEHQEAVRAYRKRRDAQAGG